MINRKFIAVLFGCLATLWSWAITFRHDVPANRYFELAAQYPAVGLVAGGGTGTLVTPTKVITAAHVAANDEQGVTTIQIRSELLGGLFTLGPDSNNPTHSAVIASVEIHPNWFQNGQFHRAYDVAVLTLATPINDVQPVTFSSGDAVGQVVTLVGYGAHGTGTEADFRLPSSFDGLKRAAQNRLDIKLPLPFPADPEVAGTLQFDFDSPSGDANTLQTVFNYTSSPDPLALEGGAGPGDSGGPMFADFGFGPTIVGITSSGGHPNSRTQEDELAGRYGSINEYAPLSFPETIAFLQGQGVPMQEGAWQQMAWLPHMTRLDGGFRTVLILENRGTMAAPYQWEGFDEQGNSLGTQGGTLEAGQVLEADPAMLFANGHPAWVTIRKQTPSCVASAVFRSTTEQGSPAHVPESQVMAQKWRFFPGDWSQVFDGLAIINRGEEAAEVVLRQYDYQGLLIQEQVLTQALPMGGKLLHVVGGPDLQTFSQGEPSYFEIHGTQSLAILALRGNQPNAQYLWENAATPLE